jgi:hypothetical protein
MSIARLMQQAAAGAAPDGVSYSYNDVLYTGKRQYVAIGSYILFAEFANSGTQIKSTDLSGEITYELAVPYDVSTGVTVSSVNWVNIDQYTNATKNTFSARGKFVRYDIPASIAYHYEGTQKTEIFGGLDGTTGDNLPLVSSSSSPFGEEPNAGLITASVYVKKADGGVAVAQTGHSLGKIYLRNYATATTDVISSFSTLDIDLVALDINSISLMSFAANGQTISLIARRASSTSQYDAHTWTLATPFDLSTVGSVTTSLSSASSAFSIQNGQVVNDHSDTSGKLVYWGGYGDMKTMAYTVDGDASTYSVFSTGNRSQLGNYYSVNMLRAYFDNGNYLLDLSYIGSGLAYGPVTPPYSWQWQDRAFTDGSNATINWAGSTELTYSPPQDGQMNAARTVLYGGFYSSTLRLNSRPFGTAGDPTTLGSSGSPAGSSSVNFTGWVGVSSAYSMWLDRDANKVHLMDGGNPSGTYFIFDLNADGTFAGTWDASPTGFSAGDFYLYKHMQPLTPSGEYFVYRANDETQFFVIKLNVPYNPIQGHTVVKTVEVKGIYPNGVVQYRAGEMGKMYVQDSIAFFTEHSANKTVRIDITIPGVLPAPAPSWTNPDLANASYDSVSLGVNPQDTQPTAVTFNNDGSKMYMIGITGDSVYQYSLSTGFDLSTASYDSVSFSVQSQDLNPFELNFNTSGTKMFVLGVNGDRIYQYTLSTGFDLSTASYDSVSFSVNPQDGTPYSFCFSPDGTKMYVAGVVTDKAYQYSLSTAFDISTASYDSVSFSLSAQDANPYGIKVGYDGTKLYMVGVSTKSVYQYSMSTAFDLSTASYDSVSFSLASQASSPLALVFNNTGSKMYITDNSSDTVYQYSTA